MRRFFRDVRVYWALIVVAFAVSCLPGCRVAQTGVDAGKGSICGVVDTVRDVGRAFCGEDAHAMPSPAAAPATSHAVVELRVTTSAPAPAPAPAPSSPGPEPISATGPCVDGKCAPAKPLAKGVGKARRRVSKDSKRLAAAKQVVEAARWETHASLGNVLERLAKVLSA